MVNRRNFLWLIPLLLVITFPAWRIPLASFLEPRGGYDPEFGKRDRDKHNFILDDVIIIQNKTGRKTAEVRAERALTSDTPNEFELTSVVADIFDESNEKVNIRAETGIYNTETRQLTLVENVRVNRAAQNQQLFSDLLYYNDKNRTINSPGKTRLTGNNIEINGGSLDYNIATNQYKLGSRVFCTITGFTQP